MDKSVQNGFYAYDKLNSSCCAKKMAHHGFCGIDLYILGSILKRKLDGSCFKQVIVMCSGSVCINIIYLRRCNTCFLHGIFHSTCGAASVLGRRCDMECVCSCTVSHNLCQDIGISLFGMLQFFQNNHTCTLAHYKTASVFIKRNGCTQRIFTCTQCSKTCKARDTDRADSSLCTTGEHYICITILNGTKSISDAMCSCRTCCYHVGTFSLCTGSDRNISGCHVCDHLRNKKRIHS